MRRISRRFTTHLSEETAAICGLFCGTCPRFGTECDGCLSGRVAPHCVECAAGFRACSSRHDVTRCFECGEFPCKRLEEFSKVHIERGICHHSRIIDDLCEMKDTGVEAWVEKQTAGHTCPECVRLIFWYDRKCRYCHPGEN